MPCARLPQYLMRDIETVAVGALRQAATDYTRDRGRFLPFAERRLIGALADYTKAMRSPKLPDYIPKLTHGNGRGGELDYSAWRRGFLARGILL